MIDILTVSAEVLTEAGFTTGRVSIYDREALAFEDATVLGFLFAYSNSAELIGAWEKDASRAIADHQFGLRRAAQKAWNAYVVLVAAEAGDYSHSAALAAIEEDLTGTRKIARAGVHDIADLRAALLTLLPLQAAAKLEAVDIQAEIRQRATELQPRAIDAFLSTAEDMVVIQVLEEAP
jgi:hypothetical protein